ncbi:uncharacterized protein LOC131890699 [Tigriopus californicus]|uniref:uncharacterized protein LOC131890699 n=1 Tax=Tigriopus californicus TaxID=6832 RepID=UPI0027DA6B99|nr:uncharacterized protein LOC131890699 [Tigriopus californicus]
MLRPNNAIYYLGAFANIKDLSKIRRNVDQTNIDSLGYPVNLTLPNDLAFCQAGQNGLDSIDEDPHVLGLVLHRTLQTYHELIQNQDDRSKQGFICEIDREWTCPYHFILIQDTCFKRMNVKKTYDGASDYCSDFGYQLARPTNIIEVEFLRQIIWEEGNNDSYWVGLSFAQDGESDQFGFFLNGSIGDCLAVTKYPNGDVQFQLKACDGTRKVICQTDQVSISAQNGKIPAPIGLFPLEKMNGTRNVLASQLAILSSVNIGFHSRQVLPLKFIGNARFTSKAHSYLKLDVLNGAKIFHRSEITLLVWMDLEDDLSQQYVLLVTKDKSTFKEISHNQSNF